MAGQTFTLALSVFPAILIDAYFPVLVHETGQVSLTRAPAWSEERARGNALRSTNKRRFFMSFSDHKITQFTHRISELADQPNMPADELKARFDACPEQLRVSLNAVCDEAAALDTKVDGILTQTFEGAIDKSMLSPALITELDEKATQAALAEEAAAREAETAARESAISSLSTRITSTESSVSQKGRITYGTYTGNDAENRTISVGFRPYFVVIANSYLVQMEMMGASIRCAQSTNMKLDVSHLTSSGFTVSVSDNPSGYRISPNDSGETYYYMAVGR